MSDDVRLSGIEAVAPYPLMAGVSLYQIPDPEMLIDSLLPVSTITGVTSAPGVGKTWLTLEMIRSLVTGTRFLNGFDVKQGAALFVGSDASVADYARQWKRMTAKEYSEYEEEHQSMGHANPFNDAQFLLQSGFLFEDLGAIRRLIATANGYLYREGVEETCEDRETGEEYTTHLQRQTGFKLIIFDTYSKLTRTDQNSNTESEEVFRNLRLLCESTGATIVLLHHNSKRNEFNGGEDWRGAMSQIGALDNWFHLVPDAREKTLITVKIKKFRGITPPNFTYKMNVGEKFLDDAHLTMAQDEDRPEVSCADGIIDDILAWLRSDYAQGKWFKIQQIASALHPQHTMLTPDKEEFQLIVARRLDAEKSRRHPRVMSIGGGRKGVALKYQSLEKPDAPPTETEEPSPSTAELRA